VLSRVVTNSDRLIRAVDGRGYRPIKEAVATAFEAAVEDFMTVEAVFAEREDGKAREILRIDDELRAAASTRRAQIEVEGARMAADYLGRRGRVPDPAAMKAILAEASLDTRKGKSERVPAGAGPGVGQAASRQAGGDP
jgi:hypothetical protein